MMHRGINEVLSSQSKILEWLGKPADSIPAEKMSQLYRTELDNIEKWLAIQSKFSMI